VTIATLHTDMRSAWRQTLQGITGLTVEWAWEGRPYFPRDGVAFVRESFRAINSEPRAVGRGGTIAHDMTGNLVLCFPAGRGTLDVETAAGLILSAMPPGTPLVYGQNSGVVTKASRSPVAVTPQWVEVPVTVNVLAYTANP
jgi:Bacteriophage related domain of unknown function